MQRDEEATYTEFERGPRLSRHDGRRIKTTGDGALLRARQARADEVIE